MKAVIALEDGTIFEGSSFGAEGEVVGEVIFNTQVVGFQVAADEGTLDAHGRDEVVFCQGRPETEALGEFVIIDIRRGSTERFGGHHAVDRGLAIALVVGEAEPVFHEPFDRVISHHG